MVYRDDRRRRTNTRWVRDLPDRRLHGLALKLREKYWQDEITERQDKLLEFLFTELLLRARRNIRDGREACNCDICMQAVTLRIEGNLRQLRWSNPG